jgi:xanthine dehydrogenase YagS FAD-binding subunit
LRLVQPDSVADAISALGNGSRALAGGTELVPLLRSRLVEADTLVDVRAVVPRGVQGTTIGAGTTLAELEADPEIPGALREACSLAASPQLRSMGTIGGNLLQATRCWYWRLSYPCFLHGGSTCHAREGAHREHAIFGNEHCASAHPSDPAAALLALGATLRTDRRELPVADLYRLPSEDIREVTALEPGELIFELEVPKPEASTYLKAMERNRFSFALVGVAAARTGGADPVASVRPGRARPRNPAAWYRVQGRPRAAARATGARSARLMIWAVVLAAGASSRFGSPKQALLLEPLLERVHASSVDDVLVVLGAHELQTSARAVHCPDWERGPGASLRRGLAALPSDAEAAVVVLGDGPELDPEAIDRVIAAWRAGSGPVVAASYAGTRLHPVLLDRDVWQEIPDEGAKTLDAVLVPCDDLSAPGDVDFADEVPERLKPWSSPDP